MAKCDIGSKEVSFGQKISITRSQVSRRTLSKQKPNVPARYRKRGPEKNHRPDPIVEMGLLMVERADDLIRHPQKYTKSVPPDLLFMS